MSEPLTDTVLDLPIVTDLQSTDYIYIIRGTGTERDKRILGSVFQAYVGDTLTEVTVTGSLDLSIFATNLIVKYNPTGNITSTITNIVPDAKKVLLWNVTAHTVSITIEGDSFDLFQNEAIEYISDGTNMKRFDMLIVDKIRAFEDDNTFIDLNADAMEFWTGGVKRLQIDNNGLSNSTGDVTINDNAVITGTLDMQGAISNSTGDVTINDNAVITGTLDMQGAISNSTGDVTVNDNLIVNDKIATNGATGANVTDGGIDIETPSDTGDAVNINNGTNDIATISNAGDLTVYGGISTNQGQPTILEKVIPIGDWKMDTTQQVTVPHGIDITKIRSVSVVIRDDSGTNFYPDGFSQAFSSPWIEFYIAEMRSDGIIIFRRDGGYCANFLFDSTSYNRGWVTIRYEK